MATPRRIHFDRVDRGGFLPEAFTAACSRSRCSRISRRDIGAPGSADVGGAVTTGSAAVGLSEVGLSGVGSAGVGCRGRVGRVWARRVWARRARAGSPRAARRRAPRSRRSAGAVARGRTGRGARSAGAHPPQGPACGRARVPPGGWLRVLPARPRCPAKLVRRRRPDGSRPARTRQPGYREGSPGSRGSRPGPGHRTPPPGRARRRARAPSRRSVIVRFDRRVVTRGPFVRLPHVGPVLACRPLDASAAPELPGWALTMGDVELF